MKYKLLNELKEREPLLHGDGTGIAPSEVREITRLIRKGAKDLTQNWKNAVHLTKKAYDVAGIKLPKITQKDAWMQYEHLISTSVRELAKHRGLRGEYAKWRMKEADPVGADTVLPKSIMPQPLGTEFKN